MKRRRFLAVGLLLTPLVTLLSACGKKADWPPGMVPIAWDRDTCTRCNMMISDRRFAAEALHSGKTHKFDDIGCAVVWLHQQGVAASERLWVADSASPAQQVHWLDAQIAHYLGGKTSPMGYNFAAVTATTPQQDGAIDFTTLQQRVLKQ